MRRGIRARGSAAFAVLPLLLLGASPLGAPPASAALRYEGTLGVATGDYIFTEQATTWTLTTAVAAGGSRLSGRVWLPIHLQSSDLMTTTGVGVRPVRRASAGRRGEPGSPRDEAGPRVARPADRNARLPGRRAQGRRGRSDGDDLAHASPHGPRFRIDLAGRQGSPGERRELRNGLVGRRRERGPPGRAEFELDRRRRRRLVESRRPRHARSGAPGAARSRWAAAGEATGSRRSTSSGGSRRSTATTAPSGSASRCRDRKVVGPPRYSSRSG